MNKTNSDRSFWPMRDITEASDDFCQPRQLSRWLLCVGLVVMIGIVSLLSPSAMADENEYIPEDVKISGKEIHAFEDGNDAVTIVLGEFRLTVGKRLITASKAVIWIDQRASGRTVLRDMTIYIEGDATISEPDGAFISDKRMLIQLRHLGRLVAKGTFVDRPLQDFPFFARAKVIRTASSTTAIAADPLAVVSKPTKPAIDPIPPFNPSGRNVWEGKTPPPSPKPLEITTIRLGKITTKTVDGDTKRITIAHAPEGQHVYIAMGTLEGKEYLELRCRSIVLFSENRPAKDTRVPYSLGKNSMGGSGLKGGEDGWSEALTGIYLQGDITITRGERTLTGPEAYYDLVTDRAIIPNGKLRTIQSQRNIPINITASQIRTLSSREMWFRDAKISTCDFNTPSYHIGAKTIYMMDTTPYAADGSAMAENSYAGEIKHSTFNVLGLPILYWPYSKTRFRQDHTALRRVTIGSDAHQGFGVDTEWHLFRLLGMLKPEGYRGRLDFGMHERGPTMGAKLWYARDNYSGYSKMLLTMDKDKKDTFGREAENIPAQDTRGRILIRHKQQLENDWELQFELSYLCDRNFLRRFEPVEFHTGKEQETLLYAKKTRDNWAFTVKAKQRINRFMTQSEASPELAFWLVGQPLLRDLVTVYSESRMGLVRQRYPNFDTREESRKFARIDSRNEIVLPLKAGAINITPYAAGRMTYWSDAPVGGKHSRAFGQVGVKVGTQFWKVYRQAKSRLWDINGLRHIISPEMTAFVGSSGGVQSDDLYPLDQDVEMHLPRLSGVSFGVHQRLQTKRGEGADRYTVDWMRLNVVAGFYSNGRDPQRSDGRFNSYRPESSIGRNHINFDYAWYISDSTALLADLNYDCDSRSVGRANLGLAVTRSPRLAYHFGWRYSKELDSSVATAGFRYKINQKYTISLSEQYDFDFSGRTNLATGFSIIRKLPRWYVALNFVYAAADDNMTLSVTIWPEGISEMRLKGSRLSLLGTSQQN